MVILNASEAGMAIYVLRINALTIYALVIYELAYNALTIYVLTIYALAIYALTIFALPMHALAMLEKFAMASKWLQNLVAA